MVSFSEWKLYRPDGQHAANDVDFGAIDDYEIDTQILTDQGEHAFECGP